MLPSARLVVADDHAVVRSGLITALRDLPGVTLVGEAGDGATLLATLRATHPDLLLTDVTMPHFEPIEMIRQIRVQWPALKILIVSAYDDDVYVQGLLSAGVHGYHLKDQPLGDLRLAVQRVLAGERWVCSPLVEKLVRAHSFDPPPAALAGKGEPGAALSERGRELLQYLWEGLDNQAIARRTGLSVKTIENHLTRLYRQIGVQSRLEAVNYLRQHPHVLGPDSPTAAPPADDIPQSAIRNPQSPAILIVDDNERYRTQLRRMVGKSYPQAQVYEAADTRSALALVARVHPRLVFADVVLGDERGIECARQIKALAPTTRIVLITAYPDREFHHAGLAAGAVALLDKGDLDAATLREVIADLLG
jgi:DNA-binding NarL/FixJ family response regulator